MRGRGRARARVASVWCEQEQSAAAKAGSFAKAVLFIEAVQVRLNAVLFCDVQAVRGPVRGGIG